MDTDTTGELGVTITQKIILKSLGWAFRVQANSDEGIDAQVEVKEDGRTTGRLLALQIKGGPSHFRKLKSGDWAFYFEERQARLWLGHALPVIIVLVDIESETAYWQRIDESTVERTKTRYRVIVRRDQLVGTAAQQWSTFASGLETRAEARYEFALDYLPPSARKLIRQLRTRAPSASALLALHLSEGRTNPAGTTTSLLTAAPWWLDDEDGLAWRAIAAYCVEHDLHKLSADSFEEAARRPDANRGRCLAAAGLNVMSVDLGRARRLLDSAARYPDATLLIRIGRTLLDHPVGDAGPRQIEPPLTDLDPEVATSIVAQSFLADQARRGNDLMTALRHARTALELEPDNSDCMAAVADVLVRRSFGAEGAANDLREASALLSKALDQRRRWAGATQDMLVQHLRALALLGDFDGMLTAALPQPEGTASVEEASHIEVLRYALEAAHFLDRDELLPTLASRLDDSARSQLERHRLGLLNLSKDDEVALWDECLSEALLEDDYQGAVVAALHLGRLGVDRTDKLSLQVDRGIIPPQSLALVSALAKAHEDLDDAVPELRELSRQDIAAAEHLMSLLASAGRFSEAAQAAHDAFVKFRQPYFQVSEASLLIDAGHLEQAESVAIKAIGSTDKFPGQVGRLLTFLAGRAADRMDWDAAEDFLSRVPRLQKRARASDVWRLVEVQMHMGAVTRAAQTILEFQPEIHSESDARTWLQAMVAIPWTEPIATQGLTLAIRFKDNPALATAILTHLIQATAGAETSEPKQESFEDRDRTSDRRPKVSDDVHRRAFEALEDLQRRHGEATGVTHLEGTTDELIEQMTAMLKRQQAGPFRELQEMAQAARVPVGLLATGRGRSYALGLVQQGFGALLAAAPDDSEHDAEVMVAASAMNGSVVVDLSSLLLTSQMRDGSSLRGRFARLAIAAAARRDVLRAIIEVRGLSASPGTVGWDPRSERIALYELSAADYARYVRRADALESVAASTIAGVADVSQLFPDLPGKERDGSWLQPIQLAHDMDAPLWSDDLGQRRLARSVGVRAFGTPALTDALNNAEIGAPEPTKDEIERLIKARQDQVREYVSEGVVDVPLHLDDVVALASVEQWAPGPAAFALSRPSWWAWQVNPLSDWGQIARHIVDNRNDALPAWWYAAMHGAAQAYTDPHYASTMLTVIATISGSVGPTPDPTLVANALRDAVEIATTRSLDDPLPQLALVSRALSKSGHIGDPDQFTADVLTEYASRAGARDDATPTSSED